MRKKRILATIASLAVIPISFAAANQSPAYAASGSYANAVATVPAADLSGVTSDSVFINDTWQGTRDSTGAYSDTGNGPNYSYAALTLTGSCDSGNNSCTQAPEVMVGVMAGHNYCSANGAPCFMATEIINGVPEIGTNNGATWHETTGGNGVADDGTFHPVFVGTGSAGGGDLFEIVLSGSQVQVWMDPLNGNDSPPYEVGYFATSDWGQSNFGTISADGLQAQVYNPGQHWTGGPIPSMDWGFSEFNDSNHNGDTSNTCGPPGSGDQCTNLSAWTVDSPYTESESWHLDGVPEFDVAGGNSPADSPVDYYPQNEASKDNGYCMDNKNGGTNNGNVIQLYQCNNGVNQEWRWDSATSRIVNENGKCLDDPNDSTTNGTKMQLYTCNSLNSQKWSISYIQNSASQDVTGFFELVNANGKCLDNTNNSSSNGTQIQIWSCLADTAQLWDAEFVNPIGGG